jgi:hypothetical protein
VPSTLDPARLAALNGAKLSAIVTDAGAVVEGQITSIGTGVAVADTEGRLWVLADAEGARLGASLAVLVRRELRELRVVIDGDGPVPGRIARRVLGLDLPVGVHRLAGRTPVDVTPDPLPVHTVASADHLAFADLIERGGAALCVEHAVVSGEVLGLEVCRVVDDPHTGAVRLEVGIGAHDRETFQLLHGDRPTVDALADVVASVARHRVAGAPVHPFNQLAASRLLRARLVSDPSLVGHRSLVAAEPPEPRANLKDEVPCVAVGHLDGGRLEAVVCTHGVDLEVVPFSIDAVARHGAASCLIAAPARDVLEVQERIAALVGVPTRFVSVPAE